MLDFDISLTWIRCLNILQHIFNFHLELCLSHGSVMGIKGLTPAVSDVMRGVDAGETGGADRLVAVGSTGRRPRWGGCEVVVGTLGV